MLRDRYDPMNLFDDIPALGLETDAVLTQLDTLLDDDVLFQAVKQDLSRRFPRTSYFGRPSTPVEAILRLLIVKHLQLELPPDRAVGQRQPGTAPVLPRVCRPRA